MNMKTKAVIFLADGMADDPQESLGGKTPLEYAHTPGMDEIASRGVNGSFLTLPPNLPTSSDVANMSVLGFQPESHGHQVGPRAVGEGGAGHMGRTEHVQALHMGQGLIGQGGHDASPLPAGYAAWADGCKRRVPKGTRHMIIPAGLPARPSLPAPWRPRQAPAAGIRGPSP